jgi:hypothetical protein
MEPERWRQIEELYHEAYVLGRVHTNLNASMIRAK